MLKLHHAPNSRAGRIVWLLEELQLPYELNRMEFHPRALKSDEHRARHPLGRVPVLEDAAESLGAKYKGRASGSFGQLSIYSFNGNKIITTSGGGMLVSNDAALMARARANGAASRGGYVAGSEPSDDASLFVANYSY